MSQNKFYISNIENIDYPDSYTLISLDKFNALENESVSEVFIHEILGSIGDNKLVSFLSSIEAKMAKDSIIHLQDIDIEQLCLYITNRVLPISAKEIFYRQRSNMWYMPAILQSIQSINTFEISQAHFINGYEFYVQIKKVS